MWPDDVVDVLPVFEIFVVSNNRSFHFNLKMSYMGLNEIRLGPGSS
jgi:hypothetical protein